MKSVAQSTGRISEEIFDLLRRLYPICRSLSGNGVRETLGILREYIPLTVHEVPTGTPAFDWTVPREWNIADAYIKDDCGNRVVDFRECNLHVMSYSVPVRRKIALDELKRHLFTLPDYPDRIPYRTSYYNENWGFCLSHERFLALADGDYEVLIDSTLADGHLSYGEYLLEGETDSEVLISTHVCHPSLANDNLSGIAVSTFLARWLRALGQRRYSYRFLFTPGTIGSIVWLSRNEKRTAKIKHGLVLACLGDAGGMTYKRSRRGNAEIDRVVACALRDSGAAHRIVDFSPFGYDERQFCSPGFDLPVGCLMRTPHGEFPEYHTSADNLDFVRPNCLADSLEKCSAIASILEENSTYLNLSPKCEPQLGKRGLYSSIGGQTGGRDRELAMLWVLNLSDGSQSLLDIAERSGIRFAAISEASTALREHGLVKVAATIGSSSI